MWLLSLSALWRWGLPRTRLGKQPVRRRPASCRLAVEVLEDRTVPSGSAPLISVGGGDHFNAGDFNNDAIPDFVIASGNLVQVGLGNGDGTFRMLSSTTYATEWVIQGPAVGDFNGDGNLDVVTLNENRGQYFLPGNGDGTFQPAHGLGLPRDQHGLFVAAGDFNGDGRSD